MEFERSKRPLTTRFLAHLGIEFYFNQFHNALNDSVAGIGAPGLNRRSRDVERYSLGFEKMLLSETMSVEVRLPTFGAADALEDGFAANSVGVGNLRVITKFLLFRSEYLAFVAGLGLTAPTGDDTQFSVADQVYTVENQAVHLLPHLAYLVNPTERFWYQSFIQLDTPTRGNDIHCRDIYGTHPTSLGRLNDQTLGYVDTSMGYWLYRNSSAPFFTKMAALLELHSAVTLQDTDRVYGYVWDANGDTTVEFSNVRNRFKVINATIGVHTEFRDRLALRLGGVVPISDGDDRFFDSEIHASVIYRY